MDTNNTSKAYKLIMGELENNNEESMKANDKKKPTKKHIQSKKKRNKLGRLQTTGSDY